MLKKGPVSVTVVPPDAEEIHSPTEQVAGCRMMSATAPLNAQCATASDNQPLAQNDPLDGVLTISRRTQAIAVKQAIKTC